ncbi:class I tRNA ligase family protein [Ruminococcus champanellensis]|uniref:class I tRNA ligase family protein n=1 Tax=Ruminococcus champanellensis TaxID=1161942 RepID=UPI0026DD46C0|nr:class I tRNA ligase family protein [Ruminococcus champanellensis]
MSEEKNFHKKPETRPEFPKRAVITGGMPYGNKTLHFGHIGGVFVFADVYARFLRDRIGEDNVIFVSGTDCYGSPIAESYRRKCAEEGFTGSIKDFVAANHQAQKQTLDDYDISLNLFGASGLGRTAEIHNQVSDRFIRRLYENGHLTRIATSQFYDAKAGAFLNGRQVVGKCPVEGCNSEKGYADECDLGHQYMPEMLINPKSTLTGETPIMKKVTNWYFNLTEQNELLNQYVAEIRTQKNVRPLVSKTIGEFLKPPVIYIKNEFLEQYEACKDQMPEHEFIEEPKKPSFTIAFKKLTDCDQACVVLAEQGIRYRTGKTLVPFRLTGNVEWGVPAPQLEGEEPLTIWVWPESLWAPISFTMAYLEQIGHNTEEWKDYWCSKDAQVYQFIGADNIYFYGVAEMGMFMALQGKDNLTTHPADGQMQLPILVANNHILFLDKKASSSGSVKPPMAADLLHYYTAEQLRMHYLGLGLGQRSVSFQPKPLNPNAKPDEADPVLKDGFLLSNVFNRIIRTCIYTTQKYYDGVMPVGEVSAPVLEAAKKAILDYERFMYRFEFHQATYVLDTYIRKASKLMVKQLGDADKKEDAQLRRQTLIDVFHMIRTAAVLLHPMAPEGTEKILEYLQLDKSFWSWDHIFEPISFFCGGQDHKLKFLEPRVDFFIRHPSQFAQSEGTEQ